jgi:cobalamin biosynthesis protein CobD/CbiB
VSAGDVAAVVVAVLTTVAFVLLVLTLVSLHRAVRDLRQVLRQLRDEAVPAAQELRATVRQANAELDRVDDLLGSAETVAGTVESASELTYRAMSRPLIRMMSLGTGLGEGVRGYRRRRREKGTT